MVECVNQYSRKLFRIFLDWHISLSHSFSSAISRVQIETWNHYLCGSISTGEAKKQHRFASIVWGFHHQSHGFDKTKQICSLHLERKSVRKQGAEPIVAWSMRTCPIHCPSRQPGSSWSRRHCRHRTDLADGHWGFGWPWFLDTSIDDRLNRLKFASTCQHMPHVPELMLVSGWLLIFTVPCL